MNCNACGIAGLLTLLCAPAFGTVFPQSDWQTRTPAEAGLRIEKLEALADLAGGAGVVVRDGYIAYEWGGASTFGDWASASKPVLSTLLFMADEQERCGIHQVVGDFQPGGSAKDSSITFFHLANMVSGYSRGENPGQAWAYNDVAINLYGYVLCHRVFGTSPPDVFDQQLGFLGFQDPVTVSTSQYGRIKVMSVRDFARFGLLWLNRGNWDGAQVIDESYFDLVTAQVPPGTPVTSSDGPESWDLGTFGGSDNQNFSGPGAYGMNFWVNTNNLWPSAPANVYHASGHGGQKTCWVVPDLNIVVAGLGGVDLGSDQAIRLILEANIPTPVDSASWGQIKAMHRD